MWSGPPVSAPANTGWPGSTPATTPQTAALRQVDSFLTRIERKIDVDHHDMGFLYSPSCVAAYKLTGDAAARDAAILAADQLISRFQPKGQFIQPGARWARRKTTATSSTAC